MYKLAKIKLVEAHRPIGVFIGTVGDDSEIEIRVPHGMVLEAQTQIEVINGKTVNYGDLELTVSPTTSQLPAMLTDAGYVLVDGLTASPRSANVFDQVHKILSDDIIGSGVNVYDVVNKKPTVNNVVFGLTYQRDEERFKELTDALSIPQITHVTDFERQIHRHASPHVYAYAACVEGVGFGDVYIKDNDNTRYFKKVDDLAPNQRANVKDNDYFIVTKDFNQYILSGYHVKWILRKASNVNIGVASMKTVLISPFETMKTTAQSLHCLVTKIVFSEAEADRGRRIITLRSNEGRLGAPNSNPVPWLLTGELRVGKTICGRYENFAYVEDLNFMCTASCEYDKSVVFNPPSSEFVNDFKLLDERPPFSNELLATTHFGFSYSDNTDLWNTFRRDFFDQLHGVIPSRPLSQNLAQDAADALMAYSRPLWNGTVAAIAYMRNNGYICLAKTGDTSLNNADRPAYKQSPLDVRVGLSDQVSPSGAVITNFDSRMLLLRKDRTSYEPVTMSGRLVIDYTVESDGPQYPVLGADQYYVVGLTGSNALGLRYDEHDDPVESVIPVFLTKSVESVNKVCAMDDHAAYRGITSVSITELANVPPSTGPDNRNDNEPPEGNDDEDVKPVTGMFLRVSDAYQVFAEQKQYDNIRRLRDLGYDDHDFVEVGQNGEFIHVKPRKWQSVRKFVQLSGLVTGGLLLVGLIFKNRNNDDITSEGDD